MNNRQDAQRELRELLGLPERDTTTAIPEILLNKNAHGSVKSAALEKFTQDLLDKPNSQVTRDEKAFLADSLKQYLETLE